MQAALFRDDPLTLDTPLLAVPVFAGEAVGEGAHPVVDRVD